MSKCPILVSLSHTLPFFPRALRSSTFRLHSRTVSRIYIFLLSRYSLSLKIFSSFSFSLLFLYFSDIFLVNTFVSYLFRQFFLTNARRTTLFRNTLFFFSLSWIPSILRWNEACNTRILHVALFAFLSTENDLHHNLRPNSGGHTSRHNSRVPSENLNGQGGCFYREK